MSVVSFPSRRSVIWLLPEPLGGWYVITGSFGWLHGSYNEALCEAHSLARSLHLQIRELAQ